jgi:hypothetical protein
VRTKWEYKEICNKEAIMARTAKELADAYYEGWRNGGWKNGQFDVDLLDPDNFSFIGPMEQFANREEFVSTLLNMVGPSMDLGDIQREFVDGDDICTIYDCVAGHATVTMAEWIHAENGTITQIRLFFDPAKFGG